MIHLFLIMIVCALLSYGMGYAADSSGTTSPSENQKTTDGDHSDDSKNISHHEKITPPQEKSANGESHDPDKADVHQDKEQIRKTSSSQSHKMSSEEIQPDKVTNHPNQVEQKLPDNLKSIPLPQDIPVSNKIVHSHFSVPATLPVSNTSFQRTQNRTATLVTVGDPADSTVKNTAEINGTTLDRKL